jgi:GntR family transcriptional repressor for pyruvate dehydrogenase complex
MAKYKAGGRWPPKGKIMNNERNEEPRTVAKPERLSQQVSRLLLSEIRSGAYKAGDRLPSELALAERYGVSRTALREALASLKQDGVVESRQGRGIIIKAPGEREAFRFSDVTEHMSQAEANYLYEMRAILESEAAALAAKRLAAKDAKRIKQYFDEMSHAVSQNESGDEAHSKFNDAITRASRNPFLVEFLDFLHGRLRSLAKELRLSTMKDPDRASLVLAEHEAICGSILARDVLGARETTLRHLRNAAQRAGLEIFAP